MVSGDLLDVVYQFIYFGVRGKIQAIHYLCVDNELKYEDVLVTGETWPEIKPKMIFGQLPCLRDGDVELVQTNAMLRYLARKHDLYGVNDLEKATIDMINDGEEDLRGKYLTMIYKNYEDGKEPFLKDLPNNLDKFEKLIQKNNGGKGFFVGDKMSFVDYNLFDLLDNLLILSSGCLDTFPGLKGFHDRMSSRQHIAKYRDTDAFKTKPINGNGKQ